GMSLVRLGRFDQAFKHLRTVHEQVEPKNPLSAGYLALCGAKGRPVREQDRLQNLQWALGLLRQFPTPEEHKKEWADICNGVFAEARAAKAPVPVEDQARLCAVLAGADLVDADAAAGFAHLAASAPDAVKPEFAWLFVRAAQQHAAAAENELDLFNL